MDRLEEIKNNLEQNRTFLEEYNRGGKCSGLGSLQYVDDVPYLLERVSQLEREEHELRITLRRLVHDIDEWEEAVEKIIGRQPRATWGDLEDARKLVC